MSTPQASCAYNLARRGGPDPSMLVGAVESIELRFLFLTVRVQLTSVHCSMPPLQRELVDRSLTSSPACQVSLRRL